MTYQMIWLVKKAGGSRLEIGRKGKGKERRNIACILDAEFNVSLVQRVNF